MIKAARKEHQISRRGVRSKSAAGKNLSGDYTEDRQVKIKQIQAGEHT